MNNLIEQLKGYLKAFEAINDGNYEGPDYFIDLVEYNGNELISMKNYLIKKFIKEPKSLSFERIENWKETFEKLFDLYFTRNIKPLTNLYKTVFIDMLKEYISNEQVEVLGSGINDTYSCITEYLREVSGTDILFIFKEKILLFHFGIND